MANFATKMARLNAIMAHVDGNTHVGTLATWRDRGFEADFISDLTRGQGERKAKTAEELLEYLCDGSPVARLVFQELLTIKAIEPLDKARWKSHQKLIAGEVSPGNAYFLQCLLRAALIDARVMHAGLSNKAKGELVDLFNDPQSSLQVIIMMYDVGAVGLNLHKACNRVLILSVPRNYSQEEQLAGRALRVSHTYQASCFAHYSVGLRLYGKYF
jgi:hypothetical protein